MSVPMKVSARRKCLHCHELFLPDPRNQYHQRYCSKRVCRRRSKTDSRRRWLQKPENQNYFRGPENSRRVKEWRKRHPGYWRKKPSAPDGPLQDFCSAQVVQNEAVGKKDSPYALLCVTRSLSERTSCRSQRRLIADIPRRSEQANRLCRETRN